MSPTEIDRPVGAPVSAPRAERRSSPLWAERQYLHLMEDLLAFGEPRPDRTGVGRRSMFGRGIDVDLEHGFPLLTTKRVHFKSVVAELLWFLTGCTNVRPLQAQGVTIWNEWADADGELGPIYGRQWRSWPTPDGETIDQIAQVVGRIRTDPFSSRLMVTAWNPAELERMALPPCHCLFQFHVHPGRVPPGADDATVVPFRLSCQVYQRSADVFLGLPFNIASYALLTHMVAQVTGLRPGWLRMRLGDAHLYANHVEQARVQLEREPRPPPVLSLAARDDIFAFTSADIAVEGYDPHPPIRAQVAA